MRAAPALTAVAALALLCCCSPRPVPTRTDRVAIDVLSDPGQQPPAAAALPSVAADGYDFTITPRADYIIGGIVVGRAGYSGDWNSLLSPCDVAIAWGKLVRTGLHRRLRWSQSGRWYFWRYGDDFPFDNAFIARYSSNNHVIPATANVRAAVRALAEGDTVELFGQLVDVDGRGGGRAVWWRTSTSRDDTGDGSCEVFYVRRIKRRGAVYE
ncbi:MAG: hypothetical protein MUF78_09335 [Candidatus Edwardsbacteria bacterium]|nr:hypothetical protein [Candidatus Edwardsbacteria bacterium]